MDTITTLWPLTKATNKSLWPDYVLSLFARDNSFATRVYLLPSKAYDAATN